MTAHLMFDGRLQVYRRGLVWHCSARLDGERFRSSTKEESLDRAKDVAEEWYLDLRGKLRGGVLKETKKKEPTFAQAAELYLDQLRVLAHGVRSPKYIQLRELRLRRFIIPFLGNDEVASINRGRIQTYQVHRTTMFLEKTSAMALAKAKTEEERLAASLRHTYISTRLMEGANIHQIANNCRTSVQMIEEFYAAHIRDRLDTRAINVLRPRRARKLEGMRKPAGDEA